jgi:hypothetical protein
MNRLPCSFSHSIADPKSFDERGIETGAITAVDVLIEVGTQVPNNLSHLPLWEFVAIRESVERRGADVQVAGRFLAGE